MIEYQNPWFRVVRQDDFYFVEELKAGHAAVTLIGFEGRLALVEQYRVASGCRLLELPRGLSEPGEDSRTCASREAREETGFEISPADLIPLGSVRPNSGILATCVDVYFGRASKSRDVSAASDGIERCVLLTPSELEQRIAAGEITDGFTLSGYMLFKAKIGDVA